MLKVILYNTLLLAFAHGHTEADLLKKSQDAHTKASKESSYAGKAQILKELEKSFETTLTQYEKKNPQEGSDQEQDVSRLFYTLEPAFNLAKLTSKDKKACARARNSVLAGATQGKSEDTPPGPRAQEALRWIELLCK